MGWVLRIGAMVMGVLLVIMTAGLWGVQATHGPSVPILTIQSDISFDTYPVQMKERLAITGLGMTMARPITPDFRSIIFLRTSADGEWNYMLAADEASVASANSIPVGTIYRLRGDGTQRQIIAKAVMPAVSYLDTVTFTADEQWIIYVGLTFQPAGTRIDLYRVRTDGTGLFNLTANFDKPIVDIAPLLSADEQWLIFGVLGSQEDIYRVPLIGGPVENLTANLPDMRLNPSQFGGDWVITWQYKEEAYFQLNVQTGQLLPLFDVVGSEQRLNVRALPPTINLVLVRTYSDNRWRAFRFGETIPIWEIDAIGSNIYATPDGEWLVWSTEQGLEKIRLDGTERQLLSEDGYVFDEKQFSPDAQWVYYFGVDPKLGFSLKRVQIATGHVEALHAAKWSEEIYPQAWSAEGDTLLITAVYYPQGTFQQLLYSFQPATNIFEEIRELKVHETFLGLGAELNRDWQPILMLGAGGVLMISATHPARRLKKWRQAVSA